MSSRSRLLSFTPPGQIAAKRSEIQVGGGLPLHLPLPGMGFRVILPDT